MLPINNGMTHEYDFYDQFGKVLHLAMVLPFKSGDYARNELRTSFVFIGS